MLKWTWYQASSRIRSAVLSEISDDWEAERAYLNMEAKMTNLCNPSLTEELFYPSGLLLDPFGIEFADKEIIRSRLGITIKPATCRARDEDVPDSIGRNTVAIRFSTSHTYLTGEEFTPTGIVFGEEEIVETRQGIPIKPPRCGACNEDIPDGIGRYFVRRGCRTNRAQLTGEEFKPTRIVFRDE